MTQNNKPRGVKTEKKGEFESKLLDLSRVIHVRAGGKKLRFRAVMIIGNKRGKVGVGVASGLDVAQAVEKATYQSKKNIIEVKIVHETIPHEVRAKFGSARVLLRPQRKGRGLVAGGTVRVICNLAGIKNISSKILGTTRNKLNNARATIAALKKLKVKSAKSKVEFKTKSYKI
ncbi:30S ribosomal protein S5 [Patescibacteria group bacterium]|nr:30S ribosomal protein S5 [Patescibacteria group bacterium]MBU4481424.1 30S ribosomal protein S5 [Patescibacteria group bacterium]